VFQPPVNFEQRNASLVQRVSQALQQQKRPGGLGKFRQLSSQFRQGSIDAIEYYEQCKDAMGDKVFMELFPELLALLPDIRKQQVNLRSDVQYAVTVCIYLQIYLVLSLCYYSTKFIMF
jgi:hypothetical protein